MLFIIYMWIKNEMKSIHHVSDYLFRRLGLEHSIYLDYSLKPESVGGMEFQCWDRILSGFIKNIVNYVLNVHERFETTSGWVKDDRMLIFGWTNCFSPML